RAARPQRREKRDQGAAPFDRQSRARTRVEIARVSRRWPSVNDRVVSLVPRGEALIDGVRVIPLRQIPDERGKVMHMLRADDPHFERFGEIYFSTVYAGVVKGWHLHERMTINYAVPFGSIKLVLFDDRAGSSTRGQ